MLKTYANGSNVLYVLKNAGHMGQVCGPILDNSNSVDNFGHWIGSKLARPVSNCDS